MTTDPNLSYNIIHEVIENAKNNHTLSKLVKFYKYKHTKSKWITMGLLKSIKFRDKLYKRMKLTNPNSREYEIMCINLKTYNTILKRSICASKQHYFASTFAKYKSECFPESFIINIKETTNTLEIANEFNTFFTNIGTNLVNNITYSGEKNVKHYLKENLNCKFTFNNVDELIVQKTTDNLSSKNDTGIDGISTNLLKQIAPKIIKYLTLFINQVFSTGIFPEKL